MPEWRAFAERLSRWSENLAGSSATTGGNSLINYQTYLLVMLFLYYFSTLREAALQEYQRRYPSDPERISRLLQRERFIVPTGYDFAAIVARRHDPQLGQFINTVLAEWERANPEKLAGLFREIDFNSAADWGDATQRQRRLAQLIEEFMDPGLVLLPPNARTTAALARQTSSLDNPAIARNVASTQPPSAGEMLINAADQTNNSNTVNNFSDSNDSSDSDRSHGPKIPNIAPTPIAALSSYLLHCLATRKVINEKVTPPEIAQLLAALMLPIPGQRIYDPSCGFGTLLLALASAVGTRNFALYGQESDPRFQTLCRLNMIFHNCDTAQIESGSSLAQPKFLMSDQLKKFDIVVSNPGFSREAWSTDNPVEDRFRRFYRGAPPPTRADYAVISHMLASVTDTGRLAIVLPHGALFRGGAESKIRQALVADNLLDAVIGLPAHLLYHLPIPMAILIFKRGRSDTDVLFIDASQDFVHDRPQNRLRPRDIARIANTYREFQTVPGYACRVTLAQLQENDCNWSIARYVSPEMALPTVDLAALQHEIKTLEAELSTVSTEIDHCLQALIQMRVVAN